MNGLPWITDSLDSFKRVIHSESRQVTVVMNGLLNHWLTQFVQNDWFIQKPGKWLLVMNVLLITNSLDSFKTDDSFQKPAMTVVMNGLLNHWLTRVVQTMIHSETSKWTVVMNGLLNHWLTRFVQTDDSSETRQVTVVMNGLLNHWLTRFVQTDDSFRNQGSDCCYERFTESLTSLDACKLLIQWESRQVTVVMNVLLNHWLTRFVQTTDSFRNQASDCCYERSAGGVHYSFAALVSVSAEMISSVLCWPVHGAGLNWHGSSCAACRWAVTPVRWVSVLSNVSILSNPLMCVC